MRGEIRGAAGNFRLRTDFSDEGAKIRSPGQYQWEASIF